MKVDFAKTGAADAAAVVPFEADAAAVPFPFVAPEPELEPDAAAPAAAGFGLGAIMNANAFFGGAAEVPSLGAMLKWVEARLRSDGERRARAVACR